MAALPCWSRLSSMPDPDDSRNLTCMSAANLQVRTQFHARKVILHISLRYFTTQSPLYIWFGYRSNQYSARASQQARSHTAVNIPKTDSKKSASDRTP